ETIFPAQLANRSCSAGECYKIMTGAQVPAETDIVIRVEDAVIDNGFVSFNLDQPKQWQNISRRAEDVAAGKIVLAAPVRITAPVVALLSVLGKQNISVRRRPSVSIITTGNEVIDPFEPVNPVQIRNSNQAQLLALLHAMHITEITVSHALDDIEELTQRFSNALGADIIISSGAVSAGDADHIPMVLEQLRVKKLLHKVAIKPGKPIWIGTRENGKIVFCLPGNPLSCLAGFILFIRPFIEACYGINQTVVSSFAIAHSINKSSSLDEFFPARRIHGTNQMERLQFNGSGDIRAAVLAEGLARHAASVQHFAAGSFLEFYPL
ncbi:MAG TPA: molybdopterin molybdotransferase MoeA, partial [Flavitalea sp.]|nr:molybdopterin molybdotransferase MoeA [Flavitalea sp.]